MVNPPATVIGSPLATYAATSASFGDPNRTTVRPTPRTRRPADGSMRQWPVYSVPSRPDSRAHICLARSGEAGLPNARPSRSSIESQPSTSASGRSAATADALRSASRPTTVAVSR